MNFADIFNPDRILLDRPAQNGEEVLRGLATLIPSVDSETVLQLVKEREEQCSTGVGNGIAIPHCRFGECRKASGSVLRLKEPVDFGAVDGRPVTLFFLIVGNEDDPKGHIRLLGKISRLAKNERTLRLLLETPSPESFFALLLENET